MTNTFEFKTNGKTSVIIENGFIKISRRGILNRLNSGNGDKNIRISALSGVQVKKPGFTTGYIQFIFSGSKDTKGVMDAVKDENSILFNKPEYDQALEMRDYIEKLVAQASTPPSLSTHSTANELFKLKSLLDQGILTQQEFDEQKAKLLHN